MGWTIGLLWFYSRPGLGIFLFTTASRTALGPTQPPIQWVPGALSLGVKWPGREADHSPPSNAEVKELVELYLHSTDTPPKRGAQLKHKDFSPFPVPNFVEIRSVVSVRRTRVQFVCFVQTTHVILRGQSARGCCLACDNKCLSNK
jgi:hypothetical protein